MVGWAETVFICFLIDEEVNKSKHFTDVNGNVLIHPKTGQPIGKMRASHRLYKLIGLKKPKIRATRKQINNTKSSTRVAGKNNNINSGKRKIKNKTRRMLAVGHNDDDELYFDDDYDEDNEEKLTTSLLESTRTGTGNLT